MLLEEFSDKYHAKQTFNNAYLNASQMALVVKNPPANAGIRDVDWEDPLEKGIATYSSILVWRIHDRRPWWAKVCGVTKSRHN